MIGKELAKKIVKVSKIEEKEVDPRGSDEV